MINSCLLWHEMPQGLLGEGRGGPRTREWDSWGLINTVCEVSTWPQPVAAFTHKRHPLLPFCRRELPSSINSHDPAWLFINPPPRHPPPSFLPPPLSPQPQKYARTRARQATEHLSDKMAEDVKSLERREMCESGDSQTQWKKKNIYGRHNEACQTVPASPEMNGQSFPLLKKGNDVSQKSPPLIASLTSVIVNYKQLSACHC